MATHILLADDHAIVRQGLRLLLQREGFEVVGEAVNGQEAVRLATETCPDVAVLDYGMPILNGVGAAREILQACPLAKVILLTMHADDRYVLEAIRLGVKGYVVKTQASTDLVRAIHEVLKGMMYLSPRVSRTLVQAYLAKSELPPDPLTHEGGRRGPGDQREDRRVPPGTHLEEARHAEHRGHRPLRDSPGPGQDLRLLRLLRGRP
ncbi:MAG: hypothetical protein DMD99_13125 [Candidatus Rokuibacteriota bacterium]|nr:MAG: hypothetical protein DMD99_13125 [Candidatus Rokubacteria bacterium]